MKRAIPAYVEKAAFWLTADDGTRIVLLHKLVPDTIYKLGARCINADNESRGETIMGLQAEEKRIK